MFYKNETLVTTISTISTSVFKNTIISKKSKIFPKLFPTYAPYYFTMMKHLHITSFFLVAGLLVMASCSERAHRAPASEIVTLPTVEQQPASVTAPKEPASPKTETPATTTACNATWKTTTTRDGTEPQQQTTKVNRIPNPQGFLLKK